MVMGNDVHKCFAHIMYFRTNQHTHLPTHNHLSLDAGFLTKSVKKTKTVFMHSVSCLIRALMPVSLNFP